jgi:predicted amidophosphoribosyltransferase
VGEERYAFPFAAGIQAGLDARGLANFDAIVPIPLSPEKAAAGELDRCKALAVHLGRLTGIPVRQYLSLSQPISKRRLQAQGCRPAEFIARYRGYLEVDNRIARYERVLLLDDAITKGSTLSAALAEIQMVKPNLDVVVAAAGQMILKAVVGDENGPAW